MKISEYLENNRGVGILSTASNNGEVNAAVYARPHLVAADKIAFIMRERLSRANIKQNAHAHYLFLEEGGKSKGIRLHLDLLEESQDPEAIKKLSRRMRQPDDEEPRYLVTFRVRKALSLLGGRELSIN
ncbi:MAG: pyridoxamine 5'-phosphate oxidase family protein [Desulfocapsaceae bacterium]